MRSIQVYVFSGGSVAQGAKVTVWVYQFGASGPLEPVYTNNDGVATVRFELDTDGEISISVNDNEKIKRGGVKDTYRIDIQG